MMTQNPQNIQADIADLKNQITELKRAGTSWRNNAEKLHAAAEHNGDGEGVARAGLAKESVDKSKQILDEAKALLDQSKKLPDEEKSKIVERVEDLVSDARNEVRDAQSTCDDAWSPYFGPEPWRNKNRHSI